jgi:hypothetical protein
MKLYNYFENLSDSNLIELNGLLLYKTLVNKKDLNVFCKERELRPLTLKEFSSYISRKKVIFIDTLKKIGIYEQNKKYKIFNNNKDYCFYLVDDDVYTEENDKSIKEGIAILKSSKIIKSYKKIEDLKNKPNIGLLIKEEANSIVTFICYDKNILKKYENINESILHPILFYGRTKNDGVDSFRKETPYKAAMVGISVAREDVSGREILYPIMAYYSNAQHLIIPDRGSVSDSAQGVWKSFLDNKGKLKPVDPIDDRTDPITKDKNDDGKVYRSTDKFIDHPKGMTNSEILKDENLTDEQRKKILTDLRKNDELNWVYKLESTAGIKEVIDELVNNHEKMQKEDPILEIYLKSLASSLFRERNID